jgi:hypothetical protein
MSSALGAWALTVLSYYASCQRASVLRKMRLIGRITLTVAVVLCEFIHSARVSRMHLRLYSKSLLATFLSCRPYGSHPGSVPSQLHPCDSYLCRIEVS